jgi:iron-sulfur cluster insertion protein
MSGCASIKTTEIEELSPVIVATNEKVHNLTSDASKSITTDDFPPAVIFTEEAANKVKTILSETALEEDNPALAHQKLRISITGGGCSGFKYEFAFTDLQNEDDDTAVEKKGVTLLIDSVSMQYLEGATIGYKEDATGEEFVITNPNASSQCGCGSSFSA